MKRRDFFKTILIGSGSLTVASTCSAGRQTDLRKTSVISGADKSRVVIAGQPGLSKRGKAITADRMDELLSRTIESLFDEKADLVWQSLFRRHDIIGLKVNCLAGKGLSTHIELTKAVCRALLRAGIRKNRIVIWDRADRDLQRAGYTIETRRNRIRCFGNNKVGYTSQVYEFGYVASQLSRLVTEHCTAIINLPILKDHGIVGVSVAMKNYFGAINNPNKYHDNVGDPYVADVNMFKDIRDKTRLTICDAIAPQYEGGPPFMPQWTWQMDSLLASTDMVAMDRIGWDIIEEQRRKNNVPSLAEAGRKPVYIETAADKAHALGTNNLNEIEVLKV